MKPETQSRRGRLFSFLYPDEKRKLDELEDQVENLLKLTESAESTRLQLQKREKQFDQLLKETGQYTDIWTNLVSGDYNPDEIDFDEYKKMTDYDTQVIAGLDLLTMGVLMKPWKINHPDEEIVKTTTAALNDMINPTFYDAMKAMLSAIPFGFSITEVVFDDYKGGKYWMPRTQNGLKTFDPEQIKFYSDPFGNLLKVGQVLGSGNIELPLDRSIIWSHEKKWGNWYGTPMLKGLYKHWFIKNAMLKFANIAYERFGSPILLGIARDEKDAANVLEAISHLYARSQAVITKHDKDDPSNIDVIESKRAEMPFDRYIRYQDEKILMRMLIGPKLFEGGGGVYGPKVPFDLMFLRFEDLRMELSGNINRLLQMITDLNWPTDTYPRIEFAPLTAEDKEAMAGRVYAAIDRELVDKDEPWIREKLDLPLRPEGFVSKIKKEEIT